VNAIRSKLDFIAAPWVGHVAPKDGDSDGKLRLLDYACGTGVVSRVRILMWAAEKGRPERDMPR